MKGRGGVVSSHVMDWARAFLQERMTAWISFSAKRSYCFKFLNAVEMSSFDDVCFSSLDASSMAAWNMALILPNSSIPLGEAVLSAVIQVLDKKPI